MSYGQPIVFIVDDDVSVRESLELLVSSSGWKPETFGPRKNSSLAHRPLLLAA